jgi:hypothetical protein
VDANVAYGSGKLDWRSVGAEGITACALGRRFMQSV